MLKRFRKNIGKKLKLASAGSQLQKLVTVDELKEEKVWLLTVSQDKKAWGKFLQAVLAAFWRKR
jgi:hypothetical protein